MRSLGPTASIFAPCAGLFEPLAALGQNVVLGQPAARLHRLDDPLAEPVQLSFKAEGVVTWRRFPTLSAIGDALFGLMRGE